MARKSGKLHFGLGALFPAAAFVAVIAGCGVQLIPPADPGRGGAAEERAPVVTERRTSTAPAARGEGLLRQAVLDGHNRARGEVDVAPLVWDNRLAADAGTYARTLAQTDQFRHADQPLDGSREGENLFQGTRDAYSYAEMVQLWIDERSDFVNLATPQFSRSGNWAGVAHYTQIVWRGTTSVGCALASNGQTDYLVCRYSPAGNVVGQTAF